MAKKKTTAKKTTLAGTFGGNSGDVPVWTYDISKTRAGGVKRRTSVKADPGLIRASAIAVAAILDRFSKGKDRGTVLRKARAILAAVEG